MHEEITENHLASFLEKETASFMIQVSIQCLFPKGIPN